MYLPMVLLVFCLIVGSSTDPVVKEKDLTNLQLNQTELVEDTTLPLECQRHVKKLRI